MNMREALAESIKSVNTPEAIAQRSRTRKRVWIGIAIAFPLILGAVFVIHPDTYVPTPEVRAAQRHALEAEESELQMRVDQMNEGLLSEQEIKQLRADIATFQKHIDEYPGGNSGK